MSEETRQYSVSVFPAQGPGDAPSSAVKLEITGEPGIISWYIQVWKEAIRVYARPEGQYAEAAGFRLFDGSGEDTAVFCEEYEIIASLMGFFCNICCEELEVSVKELVYQGAVYRDIVVLDSDCDSDVQIQAKKDGCETAVFFSGPLIDSNIRYELGNSFRAENEARRWDAWNEDEAFSLNEDEYFTEEPSGSSILAEYAARHPDGRNEDENAGDNAGASECGEDTVGPAVRNYVFFRLLANPSGGIVETGERLTYVGSCRYTETHAIHNRNRESGEPTADTLKGSVFDMHIFLEEGGSGLTFSVLLENRLYDKLSHDAEKIVFYYTPLDRALRTSPELRQGENPKNLVFRNVGGAYRNIRNPESGFVLGGLTLVPPPAPEPGSLDQESGRALYEAYLRALCKAIPDAEEYSCRDIGVFRRGGEGDGLLRLEAEGFSLAASVVWNQPLRGRMPVKLFDFMEDYPGEDMFSTIRLESMTFTDDGTGNTITLFPKDAYTITQTEKPDDEEDPDDYEKRTSYIKADSALQILITDPEGNELYNGDFGELRKCNVFGSVKLPETIRFSTDFAHFMENIRIYQNIKKGILDYGVRKLLVVFARMRPDGQEEIEKLLYVRGDTPSETVTALALKMKRQFIRTGEIPNIALVGQAGTGKTTMAKRIGAIFGKKVMVYAPSDLKGAYIGQTQPRVVKELIKTLKAGAIFFIDEAYELMSDKFGQEAVALLLPVMSGDREEIEVLDIADDKSGKRTPISVNFKNRQIKIGDETSTYPEPNYPIIWMGGYEDEIRLMLGENKGLYRRMERIALETPTPEQLIDVLNKKLEEPEVSIDPLCCEVLTRQFRLNREMLINFFFWAGQTQNSRYFANYAGVERFLNDCMDGIDFTLPEDRITDRISDIITETKRDIKRQLDVVRRKAESDQKAGRRSAAAYDDTDSIQMIVDNKARFKDLKGCDSQVRYLQSVIDMFREKTFFEQRGVTVPKGVLLLGPPGVGKTFIARAMAGELQRQFEEQLRRQLDSRSCDELSDGEENTDKRAGKQVGFMSLSAPEIITRPVSFIGRLFDKAEEYDVCVIFIDEVDAIAKNRFKNAPYSHFIELIKQMDGVEQRANVFIMAATNAPESLDPAFVRSGRIDRKLEFTLPDSEVRAELAEMYIKKRCGVIANFSDSDENEKRIKLVAKKVAGLTSGNTPGDIENIINEAFIMYHRGWTPPEGYAWPPEEDMHSLPEEWRRLYDAVREMVERSSIGDPRPTEIEEEEFHVGKNDESCSATAVHEVGHALASILCGCEPFESITCLPRGEALGYVTPKRGALRTKKDYENRICTAMGGRIAEEIVYGPDNISAGACADIRQATALAREMVERVGFTDDFGFMTVKESTARYLGEDKYSCSDSFREASDRAVSDLLKRLYGETMEMLSDKENLIVLLAFAAFEVRVMTGEVFMRFYDSLKDMSAGELAQKRKKMVPGEK